MKFFFSRVVLPIFRGMAVRNLYVDINKTKTAEKILFTYFLHFSEDSMPVPFVKVGIKN